MKGKMSELLSDFFKDREKTVNIEELEKELNAEMMELYHSKENIEKRPQAKGDSDLTGNFDADSETGSTTGGETDNDSDSKSTVDHDDFDDEVKRGVRHVQLHHHG